jgi:spermidine synthase
VLIGQATPSPISLDSVQTRLDRPDYARVLASIGDVGFHSAVELLATYEGRASDLQPYVAGADINDDMNLRLQYLAGLGLNSMAFEKIYLELTAYRTFPEGLFTGSEARMNVLRSRFRPVVHR